MKNAAQTFQAAIETFFHANHYNPHLFKATLTDYPSSPRNVLIRAGFEQTLAQKNLSPQPWEGLTNSLIDTQEEVDHLLQAIWAYVYEAGPLPEW